MYISVICADKIQPVPLGILRIDLQLQSIRMENQKKKRKNKKPTATIYRQCEGMKGKI